MLSYQSMEWMVQSLGREGQQQSRSGHCSQREESSKRYFVKKKLRESVARPSVSNGEVDTVLNVKLRVHPSSVWWVRPSSVWWL